MKDFDAKAVERENALGISISDHLEADLRDTFIRVGGDAGAKEVADRADEMLKHGDIIDMVCARLILLGLIRIKTLVSQEAIDKGRPLNQSDISESGRA